MGRAVSSKHRVSKVSQMHGTHTHTKFEAMPQMGSLLSSVCNIWTPVLGVKQSDVSHITHATLAYYLCSLWVSPSFHCSSFLVCVWLFCLHPSGS
jgi:hypothetical protein